MSYGFGIDLAGYSTGRSASAVASFEHDSLSVAILTNCPLARVRSSSDDAKAAVREDAEFLTNLSQFGPVAVDIPIDLQGLPNAGASKIWQLTKRPIDFALGAMPPFADRIGSPTARFQRIIEHAHLSRFVGEWLFETYPGGSLRRLNGTRHSIVSEGDAHRLGLTLDHIDAAICAMAALPDFRLEKEELIGELKDQFERKGIDQPTAPRGYALLKRLPPAPIRISKQSADEWLSDHL